MGDRDDNWKRECERFEFSKSWETATMIIAYEPETKKAIEKVIDVFKDYILTSYILICYGLTNSAISTSALTMCEGASAISVAA